MNLLYLEAGGGGVQGNSHSRIWADSKELLQYYTVTTALPPSMPTMKDTGLEPKNVKSDIPLSYHISDKQNVEENYEYNIHQAHLPASAHWMM